MNDAGAVTGPPRSAGFRRASGAGRELELAFLLAGTEERRAALSDRARAVLEHADFDVLTRELSTRRLLPLIGSRILELRRDVAPLAFREAVGGAIVLARARALAIEQVTRDVSAGLADAGVRALPIKGPLLAHEAHGDAGLRETADVDLLVERGRLGDAVETLARAGFAAPSDPVRPGGLPDLHFRLCHPTLPEVEVHWRIDWYERAFSADMLARATPADDGLLRARPDDLATSLLLYYARDGLHGVRLAADIAGWFDRHRGAAAPGFLAAHAHRYPELAPALTAAAVAAERISGVPATGWLGDGAVRGRRVDLAARLADWSAVADRDQLAANISLVGGLLGSRRSLAAFARRELTLPGASRAASGSHALKTCARCALALWRVRGRRDWAPAPTR